MKEMKERILRDAKIIGDNILKVDSFLNHQIDPLLMKKAADEFAQRFAGQHIDKILTIEASGIAVAILTGLAMGVPVVFAKKAKPSTMMAGSYTARVQSFTKGTHHDVVISSEYIGRDEHVLIVDDFLAGGHAVCGLMEMLDQAGARLVGIGIVIEKGFQEGGRLLRDRGVRVESLAIVDSLQNNSIVFRE